MVKEKGYKIVNNKAMVPFEDYILFIFGFASDEMKEELRKAKDKIRKVTYGRNSDRSI